MTFPFEFGVMFGDVGHGTILFLAGLYLCYKASEFKASGGVWKDMAGLRYMITMMGFFSIYNGAVYNDLFSVKMPF